MWANAASDLLQNDWQHPTPLWSSLYTSHTEKKKIKSESQIIVLMLQFTEEKTKVSDVGKEAPALTMQSLLHCMCGP